uniref:Uncharacterized protein n=1 Tax=Cacopsylla melanoneura TaxID=428564 RepID=A0A8D8TTA1_9HEMI
MSLFSLSETNSCCLERIKTEPLDDTNDFPAESKNQPDMGVDPLAVVKHESSDPTSDDNNASQLSEIFEVVKDIYAVVIRVEAKVDSVGTLERTPYESQDIYYLVYHVNHAAIWRSGKRCLKTRHGLHH